MATMFFNIINYFSLEYKLWVNYNLKILFREIEYPDIERDAGYKNQISIIA